MGTITMSGFNKIDWSAILQAVMTQERQPLTTMQTQQSALSAKSSAFSTLATKLGTLQSAAEDLTDVSALSGRTVTSTDESIVKASGGSSAMIGTYDVVVNSVARAQVTTIGSSSPTTAPIADKDQTVVTTGGSMTFHSPTAKWSDVTVNLAPGNYTLQQVADAINGTDGAPARATIVQANGNYQLVLTGNGTGLSNAFEVTNNFSGGVTWGQTAAMAASDADVDINNVKVTSSTNFIEDAIAGVGLTLLRESKGAPVSIGVTEDKSVTEDKVNAFVSAFNDIVAFSNSQSASARSGDKGSLGFDPLLRGLRSTLSGAISQSYSVGGAFGYLSEIGVEFTRTGTLQLNASMFGDAMDTHRTDLQKLLAGSSGVTGAFGAIKSIIDDYTSSGGLVPDAKARLDAQVTGLTTRMQAEEDRLAIRQQALQAEYSAADALISQLNSQGSSLSSLVTSYSAF
jgi:flagellar hook-associated protein 2